MEENKSLDVIIPITSNQQLVTTTAEIVQSKPHFTPKPADRHCNGKVHRQLRYCQRPAGWGTDHAGIGRCKLHYGSASGSKSGQLRYSDFVPSAIVEKYEEFSQEDDKDIKSLNDEIALIRAKITDLETKNANGNGNKDLMQFTELVRRLIETKDKIECGVKSKVTIEVVVKLIDEVIKIVDKNVQDIDTKKVIAGEMRRLNYTQLGLN